MNPDDRDLLHRDRLPVTTTPAPTMIATSKHVLSEITRHREELRQLGVRRLGLIGSTARQEATEKSDLDFLLELDRKTFDAYMDVKELLEGIFPQPIDLVLADAVKPQFRSRILQEAIYAEGLSSLP
jgi:uncharacterized protein